MSVFATLSIDKLTRLLGTSKCPAVIDVRTDDEFRSDPRLIPGSVRRPGAAVAEWAPAMQGHAAVVVCRKGLETSQGGAAWLRHAGTTTERLDGGFLGWADAGMLLYDAFFRWCRDAIDEVHNWRSNKPPKPARS